MSGTQNTNIQNNYESNKNVSIINKLNTIKDTMTKNILNIDESKFSNVDENLKKLLENINKFVDDIKLLPELSIGNTNISKIYKINKP
jgi:hypothetical protein